MRRTPPLILLTAIVLAASACSSSASPGPQGGGPPVGQYYQPTPPPLPARTPYGGVTFQDPGVNPPVDPTEDRVSTFALDVDTASYTVTRRFIADGRLPDPASVRPEEFINYFDQGYAAPEDGAFAIQADGGPTPFLPADERLVRIGIKARTVADRQRPRASLTFVIDVSGSMAREDRLGLVKQSLRLLVDRLGPDDSVAVVVFGSDARTVLQPTSGEDRSRILAAIDGLEPEGSTNAEAGLRLGYGIAARHLVEDGINRVILASDGVANVGLTDPQSILGRIKRDASAGIQLVTVGVGMGNYNDVLLEQLADQGDGFYAYVDTLDEARRLFVDDLTSTLDTIALDAKVQVDFDPAVVAEYRLIGFENRAVADDQFRNNHVAAGAIGAGHEVTALYAIRFNEGVRSSDRIGTVTLRWTDPATRRASEKSLDIDGRDMADSFRSTDPHFKLDAIVAAAAETFRGSPWIDGYRIHDVANEADAVSEGLPHTEQVRDLLDLLHGAARLGD
jgi:Ca-activated chloride channel family protein